MKADLVSSRNDVELKDLMCYSPSKDSMHVPLESVKCQQREPAREVKVVDRPYLEWDKDSGFVELQHPYLWKREAEEKIRGN